MSQSSGAPQSLPGPPSSSSSFSSNSSSSSSLCCSLPGLEAPAAGCSTVLMSVRVSGSHSGLRPLCAPGCGDQALRLQLSMDPGKAGEFRLALRHSSGTNAVTGSSHPLTQPLHSNLSHAFSRFMGFQSYIVFPLDHSASRDQCYCLQPRR